MARLISPFDDSLQKDRRRGTSNQSTNTSNFDAYRQGVELTKPSHYANGIAKIHDGYNDQTGIHGVSDLVLGQQRPILRDFNSYLDTEKLNPVSRLSDTAPATANVTAQILEDVAAKDGTIEPLEIRNVVNLRTHPKDVRHRIGGALDEGNINDRMSSEVFVIIVKRSDLYVGNFPFLDEADVMGQMSVKSETISPDNRRRGPFSDNQENNERLIDELSMENDLRVALRSMRPQGDNILPSTFIQVGATGFV